MYVHLCMSIYILNVCRCTWVCSVALPSDAPPSTGSCGVRRAARAQCALVGGVSAADFLQAARGQPWGEVPIFSDTDWPKYCECTRCACARFPQCVQRAPCPRCPKRAWWPQCPQRARWPQCPQRARWPQRVNYPERHQLACIEHSF